MVRKLIRKETAEIVQMVLAGKINKHLVNHSEFFRADTAVHGEFVRNIVDTYED